MFHLIYGGSGSGKSEYAESLVRKEKQGQRYYVATMQVLDEESRQRVERHKAMRAGKKFVTIECSRKIETIMQMGITGQDTVLLECLSNLVANEMFLPDQKQLPDAEQLAEDIMDGIQKVRKGCKNLLIVSNDIFSDGQQYDESVEQYKRALGILHRRIAQQANQVTEVVYGIPITMCRKGKRYAKQEQSRT